MKEEVRKLQHNCVFLSLLELKKQQDQLSGNPTSCFSSLLCKILKVDTIPLMLFREDGPLELAGFKYGESSEHFHTSFFRLEHLYEEKQCATLSLLRPLTLYGHPAWDICDVDRLEKTSICVTVDLSCFCAVQCLDMDLLKKVIIEPKW